MVSLSVSDTPHSPPEGLRPVNLRTDLGPLADLIELAFSDSMDSSGRAAVREMRTLSRIGPGLSLLAGVNELTQGISLGYVWVADGRIIGNVSIYSANYPSSFGSAWIIANVAVHPSYRRQGIAHKMMEASMAMIRARGGRRAVLQVDYENTGARRLYERLGFASDGVWTTWRRPTTGRVPPAVSPGSVYITRRRHGEWRQEYELARRLRPATAGGMGWLRPMHESLFHRTLGKTITDWVSLRTVERLVVHSEDQRQILASLWVDTMLAGSNVHLTLLVEPAFQGVYDDALINLAVRRFGARQPLVLEHPTDEAAVGDVLHQYYFRAQRTLVHMSWDAR